MINQNKEPKSDIRNEIEILKNELKALLTCCEEDFSVFFERASSRSLPMLLKEKRLKEFFKASREHNIEVEKHKRKSLERFNTSRKKMGMDRILPSLKNKQESALIIEDELNDRWIQESLKWVMDLYEKKGKLNQVEFEFLEELDLWYMNRDQDYPIGTHPLVSLARFEEIGSWYKKLKQADKSLLLLKGYPKYVKKRRFELEVAAKNLIAELPNIRLWGIHSKQSIKWRDQSLDLAKKIWNDNPNLHRTIIARIVHRHIQTTGANVSFDAIYKALSAVDPRDERERNSARGIRVKS